MRWPATPVSSRFAQCGRRRSSPLARTRVELAGNDLELERLRLVRALDLRPLGAVLFGVGLPMLIGLVLILNWESRRGAGSVGGGFRRRGHPSMLR